MRGFIFLARASIYSVLAFNCFGENVVQFLVNDSMNSQDQVSGMYVQESTNNIYTRLDDAYSLRYGAFNVSPYWGDTTGWYILSAGDGDKIHVTGGSWAGAPWNCPVDDWESLRRDPDANWVYPGDVVSVTLLNSEKLLDETGDYVTVELGENTGIFIKLTDPELVSLLRDMKPQEPGWWYVDDTDGSYHYHFDNDDLLYEDGFYDPSVSGLPYDIESPEVTWEWNPSDGTNAGFWEPIIPTGQVANFAPDSVWLEGILSELEKQSDMMGRGVSVTNNLDVNITNQLSTSVSNFVSADMYSNSLAVDPSFTNVDLSGVADVQAGTTNGIAGYWTESTNGVASAEVVGMSGTMTNYIGELPAIQFPTRQESAVIDIPWPERYDTSGKITATISSTAYGSGTRDLIRIICIAVYLISTWRKVAERMAGGL